MSVARGTTYLALDVEDSDETGHVGDMYGSSSLEECVVGRVQLDGNRRPFKSWSTFDLVPHYD